MRKFQKIFIICLFLSLMLIPTKSALAYTPGSAGDPLVSKSWVDSYIEDQFAPLEDQIAHLKALILKKLGLSEVNIKLYIGNSIAYVDDIATPIDDERPKVVPQLKTDSSGGGYTMVPVRFIAENMGLTVQWLSSTNQVVFSDANNKIVLTIGSSDAIINGEEFTMGYAPYIENQRTYVHIRFVAEAFNCKVGWKQDEKRVDITR
jgi:hypothetical protein